MENKTLTAAADRYEMLSRCIIRRRRNLQAHVRKALNGPIARAFRLAQKRGEMNRYGYRLARLAAGQASLDLFCKARQMNARALAQ